MSIRFDALCDEKLCDEKPCDEKLYDEKLLDENCANQSSSTRNVMSVALYPGSFDPVHNGHLQVIAAASALFDSVIVGVGHNPAKPSGLFTPDERAAMISESVAGMHGVDLANVRVELFVGLATDAAISLGADCLLKGVRGGSDLDAEMQQATMNSLTASVPTLFAPAMGEASLVSSRYVREIAALGGDITSVVPPAVAARLNERFAS